LEASGRGDLLAEAYRLQSELLLQQATSDMAGAEACFPQALAVARRQQARSWELRVAMSLSRLWQQQGKRAEAQAQALLAPLYGWFTEGFDTADLQDAQALLAEVNQVLAALHLRKHPDKTFIGRVETRLGGLLVNVSAMRNSMGSSHPIPVLP
jgi:predicted ATPase